MKIEIVVPASGESVSEGDIAKWFKQSGEFVAMDEALLELETDKASLEITAEADGQLEIVEEEGTTVKVGQIIGYISQEFKKVETSDNGEANGSSPKETGLAEGFDNSGKAVVQSISSGVPSPAAKKLLLDHGIELGEIRGTGKGGRVTKADVLRYLEIKDSPEEMQSEKRKFTDFYNPNVPAISPDETVTLFRRPPTSEIPEDYNLPSEISNDLTKSTLAPKRRSTLNAPINHETMEQDSIDSKKSRNIRREKMSRLRRTIAGHLVEAQHRAALLTTFNEIDMTAIKEIRQKYKEDFKETHKTNLGILSFFTTAVCQALREYPIINAQMDNSDIIYFDYYDIGIAVATERGLVVPIIRSVESMSFAEIESKIRELAQKARNGDLTLDDLSGGTFTITNGGVFGSLLSTPIVNQPQSAVLGMHNISDRPIAKDGEVVIRPMMYVALTYDHRLIDGADAVAFLIKVKTLCEDPVKLILGL